MPSAYHADMLSEYVSTLAVALLFLLSVLGWGSLLSALIRRAEVRLLQDVVARFVLGCGVIYGIALALSLFGRLHRVEVAIAIGLGVVAGCPLLSSIAHSSFETLRRVESWETADQILLGAVTLLAGLQLAFGLTPLIFYDSLVYHLFAPAQFLLSGSLTHIPWNVHASSPLALQFTLGMSLVLDDSGQVAKLFYTLMGCLLAVGAYELIRPTGRRAALAAALCIVCYPEFWIMQTLGVTDLAVAALLLFGTIWARGAFKDSDRRLAILAGIALGFAIGSKYQAVVLMAWFMIAVIAEALLELPPEKRTRMFQSLVIMGCLCLAVTTPWLVRNYVHLGNPVFPLMPSIWGLGGEWSPPQADQLGADLFGSSITTLPLASKLLGPFRLLTDLSRNGIFATVLLLVGLIGLAVAKPSIRMTATLGAGGLLLWGVIRPTGGMPLIRFNALSIVCLLAASGAVLGSGWVFKRAGTWIALGLALCSVLYGVYRVQGVIPAAQSLVNRHARETLVRANVPSWEAFTYVNKNLDAAHSKIMLIGETRGFWLKIPAIVPSAFNGPQLAELFAGDSGPTEWDAELTRRGVTHLLVNSSEIERLHKKNAYFSLSRQQTEKVNRWISSLPAVYSDPSGNAVLALKRETSEDGSRATAAAEGTSP
jgi:Dolichyl-phosphate-mannose-protein mannosyltransferase